MIVVLKGLIIAAYCVALYIAWRRGWIETVWKDLNAGIKALGRWLNTTIEPGPNYPKCKVLHEIACLELNLEGRVCDSDVLEHMKTCRDRWGKLTEDGWVMLNNPKPRYRAPVLSIGTEKTLR